MNRRFTFGFSGQVVTTKREPPQDGLTTDLGGKTIEDLVSRLE